MESIFEEIYNNPPQNFKLSELPTFLYSNAHHKYIGEVRMRKFLEIYPPLTYKKYIYYVLSFLI